MRFLLFCKLTIVVINFSISIFKFFAGVTVTGSPASANYHLLNRRPKGEAYPNRYEFDEVLFQTKLTKKAWISSENSVLFCK